MSTLQRFRDGGVSIPWTKVLALVKAVLALGMVALTMLNYYQGDIQRATFDAVIALWLAA